MKLRTKLTALIVGGFVLGYLMIAFVTLEIDFRNWSEDARSGFLAVYLWVIVVVCFWTWMRHDEGGDK